MVLRSNQQLRFRIAAATPLKCQHQRPQLLLLRHFEAACRLACVLASVWLGSCGCSTCRQYMQHNDRQYKWVESRRYVLQDSRCYM
jgi:hypothetical protein